MASEEAAAWTQAAQAPRAQPRAQVADQPPVLGEITPLKTHQTQEGFVNRIDFEVGAELLKRLHHALR